MKKATTLMLGLILFVATLYGASAITNEWTNYKRNPQQMGSQYDEDVETGVIWETTGNLGSGSKYDPIVKDFDGDSINEMVIRVGTSMKYYEFSSGSLTQLSSLSLVGSGSISLAEDQCDSGRGGIVAASSGSTKLYCVNSSNELYLADSHGTGYHDAEDGVTCEKLSGNPRCFWRSGAEQYTVCQISGTSFTSCANHAFPSTFNTSGIIQTPPLADMDGDSDLDAVFWCRNATEVGIAVVDENGNSVMPCYTSGAQGTTTSGRLAPILISDNNEIAYRGGPFAGAVGNWELVDLTGTRVTITTAGGTGTFNCAEDVYSPAGDALFIDTNDDGFNDKFCWTAYTRASTSKDSGELYCASESSWGSGSRTTELCIGGAEVGELHCSPSLRCQGVYDGLAAGNLDPLKTGDEIITSGNFRVTPGSVGAGKIVSPAQDEILSTFTVNIDNNTVTNAATEILTPTIVDLDGNGDLDVIWTGPSVLEIYYTSTTPPPPPPPGAEGHPEFERINKGGIAGATVYADDGASPTYFPTVTVVYNGSGTYPITYSYGLNSGLDLANTHAMMVQEWTPSLETTYTSMTDMESNLVPSQARTNSTPAYENGTWYVNYVVTSDNTVFRHKWYAWYTNTSTTRDTQLFDDDLNPPEGYTLFTSESIETTIATVKDCDNLLITIPGALVWVEEFRRSGIPRMIAYTNSDGEAKFQVPGTHSYEYNVTASGWIFRDTGSTFGGNDLTLCMDRTDNFTLDVLVVDEETSEGVAGANVSIRIVHTIIESALTDSNGIASFVLDADVEYLVKADKTPDYFISAYHTVRLVRNTGITIPLQPGLAGAANAHITIIDGSTGIPQQNVYVQLNDYLTGDLRNDFTGPDGDVLFNALIDSTIYDVTAIKHLFTDGEFELLTILNQTVYVEYEIFKESIDDISLIEIDGEVFQTVCNGLWIGEMVNVECTDDFDCVTDSCSPTGSCSPFNWTWCDANGRPRNNRCIAAAQVDCTLESSTDWIFDNFLYALVIVLMFFAFLMLLITFRSRKK